MGRCTRKGKMAAEIVLNEAKHSSLGVSSTRPKTLASQRLRKSTLPAPPVSSRISYLLLRSRMLKKQLKVRPSHDSRKQRQKDKFGSVRQNPSLRVPLKQMGEFDAEKLIGEKEIEETKDIGNYNNVGLAVEPEYGDNVVQIEGRKSRSTRKSTPCSLTRQPVAITTPASTTNPSSSTATNRRIQKSIYGHLPRNEMDEFFSVAEEEERKQFVEKYNFDIVNDMPLPGRYDWERLDTWSI